MDDIHLLEGLLNRYSPPENENEAVTYLVSEMLLAGFDSTFIDRIGNAVGSRGTGKKELVLLGHIDTVPGFIDVKREGDCLWGRGSVDAKGPLACFTAAAARAQIGIDWKVTVIGAVCEEGDSRGAKFLVDKYRPELVVIGEPSGWSRITLGYKGSAWVKFTLNRPLAHTAARAKSACEAAFAFWTRVTDFCNQFNEDKEKNFYQLTPSLRDMGSIQDGFTDTAYLFMNFRLPPDISTIYLMERLESIKEDGELIMEDGVSSYRAEKNSSLVRAFLSSIRKYAGNPIFTTKTGTSDMNVVAPVWNVPILAYGPGDSDLDHTPHEHILISEYQKSIQILQNVIELVTRQE